MFPTLGKITRTAVVMGFVRYAVDVTYGGEPPMRVAFQGVDKETGGTVVMMTPGNPGGTFVSDPGRHGAFGAEWVRRFFIAR